MMPDTNLWADAKRVLVNVAGFSSDHGIRIARNRKVKLIGLKGTMPVDGAEVGKQADSWRDLQLGRGIPAIKIRRLKLRILCKSQMRIAAKQLGSRRVLCHYSERKWPQ